MPAKTAKPMPRIIERKLEFEFPGDWQAIAYDRPTNPVRDEPTSFYRRVVEKGGVQYVRDTVMKSKKSGKIFYLWPS